MFFTIQNNCVDILHPTFICFSCGKQCSNLYIAWTLVSVEIKRTMFYGEYKMVN